MTMLEGHDPCRFLQDRDKFKKEILNEVTKANEEQDEKIGRRIDKVEENIKDFMQNGFYKKLLNDTMTMNQELIKGAMQNSFGIKTKRIDLWKAIGLALLGAFGLKLFDFLSSLLGR
jgi:mevalonate kinase